MKLYELEKEIDLFKRIRRSDTHDESYYIKSMLGGESPLIFCNFMSLEMHEAKLTLHDIFADDWEVIPNNEPGE